MQDQGKRLLLFVVIAAGVLLLSNFVMRKNEPAKSPATAGETARPTAPQVGVASGSGSAPSGGPAPSTPGAEAPSAIAAPAAEAPRPPEAILTLRFDNVVATFSSYCGGLKSWQLVAARYERDATKGYLLPEKSMMTTTDGAGKTGPVPPDQLVNLPACGAFDVNFASSTYVIPPSAVWTGEQVSRTELRYTYSSERLEVVKTFTVIPERYLVRMVVKVNARVPEGTEAKQQLAVSMYAFQDPAGLKSGSSRVTPRVWSSSTLRDNTLYETDVNALLEWPRFEPVFQWTGFEHPYLLVAYALPPTAGEHVEKHTSAPKGQAGLPLGFMQTHLLFTPASFKHGDAALTKEVVAYLGPKNYDDLEQADTAAGFSTGYRQTVDLGWFAFIGRPLLWLLQKFHGLTGNWGISIVLLTIVVKLLTLYWTTKSMRSMKAMAALAPQLKVLQQKYGSDKQRQQAETMALYKQHNVNPVAGCLPILLQMPIWLALYRMLSSAGELYHEPLIWGWVEDLTATDPYYILPAVLFITMFIQARLQPATMDSTQQKFLQYGMPLMFGVMAFFFPAGLTLYIFTNTVLSALHSIYMNKFDKKSLVIAQQLKKNQDVAASALAAPGAAAKPAAKNGGPTKAKRGLDVIDVASTEVSGAKPGDDAEADDASAAAGAGAGAARNRPRRKKRKR